MKMDTEIIDHIDMATE